jgi:hypothetical protein
VGNTRDNCRQSGRGIRAGCQRIPWQPINPNPPWRRYIPKNFDLNWCRANRSDKSSLTRSSL